MPDFSGWIDAVARASIQGAILVAAVWVALRLVRRLPVEARSSIWLVAIAKFGLALFVLWEVPLLPAEAPPSLEALIPVAQMAQTGPAPVNSAESLQAAAFGLWAAVLTIIAIRALFAHAVLRRLVVESDPAPHRVQQIADGLAGRPMLVRLHPDPPVPFVTGLLRPIILLPEGMGAELDGPELEMVLAHEIAHIERRDTISGLFCFACQAIFFFHPAIWIARKEWQIARESACDQAAMRRTGASARDYAALLIKISAHSAHAPALAVSAVPAAKTLHRRIENMKNTHKKTRLSRIGALAAIGMVAAVAAPIAFVPRLPVQVPAKSEDLQAQPQRKKAPGVDLRAHQNQKKTLHELIRELRAMRKSGAGIDKAALDRLSGRLSELASKDAPKVIEGLRLDPKIVDGRLLKMRVQGLTMDQAALVEGVRLNPRLQKLLKDQGGMEQRAKELAKIQVPSAADRARLELELQKLLKDQGGMEERAKELAKIQIPSAVDRARMEKEIQKLLKDQGGMEERAKELAKIQIPSAVDRARMEKEIQKLLKDQGGMEERAKELAKSIKPQTKLDLKGLKGLKTKLDLKGLTGLKTKLDLKGITGLKRQGAEGESVPAEVRARLDAIRRFLSSPEARQEIAKAAREIREAVEGGKMTEEQAADRMSALIEKLMSRGGGDR